LRKKPTTLKYVNIDDIIEMRRLLVLLRRELPERLRYLQSQMSKIEREAEPCLYDHEYKKLGCEYEKLIRFDREDKEMQVLVQSDPMGYHGKVGYFAWFVYQ
jgi:hypothetical protein